MALSVHTRTTSKRGALGYEWMDCSAPSKGGLQCREETGWQPRPQHTGSSSNAREPCISVQLQTSCHIGAPSSYGCSQQFRTPFITPRCPIYLRHQGIWSRSASIPTCLSRFQGGALLCRCGFLMGLRKGIDFQYSCFLVVRSRVKSSKLLCV